jgi:hypothetical protein
MSGETSADHLQRPTDRPVPNEQHRESHSLKHHPPTREQYFSTEIVVLFLRRDFKVTMVRAESGSRLWSLS